MYKVEYTDHDGSAKTWRHNGAFLYVQKYIEGLTAEGLSYRVYERTSFGSWVLLHV